jgi:hypothetical protein
MKIRSTVLRPIALCLPVLLLLQPRVQGQTTGVSVPGAPAEPPPASARPLYYTHTSSFPGGTPRDFMEAAETMFHPVSFEKLSVPTNVNWSVGWQERLREAEKELHATKVDWLSIADIPNEMMVVKVPRLRFELTFMLLDGRLSWTRHTASGSDEGMSLIWQVRDNLKNVVALYNRLGHERTELGQLLVEGNLEKPSAVMVVRDKSAIATQPVMKVKAFSLVGIPEKSLDSLQQDVRNAQDQAQLYSQVYGRGTIGPGMINIHAATHLLVATGSEAYVQMVESVVEAYRPKDQLIEMKPSKEK